MLSDGVKPSASAPDEASRSDGLEASAWRSRRPEAIAARCRVSLALGAPQLIVVVLLEEPPELGGEALQSLLDEHLV